MFLKDYHIVAADQADEVPEILPGREPRHRRLHVPCLGHPVGRAARNLRRKRSPRFEVRLKVRKTTHFFFS